MICHQAKHTILITLLLITSYPFPFYLIPFLLPFYSVVILYSAILVPVPMSGQQHQISIILQCFVTKFIFHIYDYAYKYEFAKGNEMCLESLATNIRCHQSENRFNYSSIQWRVLFAYFLSSALWNIYNDDDNLDYTPSH